MEKRTYRGAVRVDASAPAPKERAPMPQTVGGYLAAYVDGLAASGAIERTTAAGYRSTAARIGRAMGGVPLQSLTPRAVREWEAALAASGLSPSTRGKCHRLLRQALAQAVADGLVDRNPTDGVRAPRRGNVSPGINALDRGTRVRLVRELGGMEPTPVVAGATVALWTGVREGEACGLQWRDVDAEGGRLWVRRSVGEAAGGCYLKQPKAGRARDACLPAPLARFLEGLRAYQGGPAPSAYLLTGTADYLAPSRLGRGWAVLRDAMGLVGCEGRPATFHDLRHTWATAAVAAGVDIKTVASNLGHANAAMTLNVYASADPDAKRRAAEAMERAMGGL